MPRQRGYVIREATPPQVEAKQPSDQPTTPTFVGSNQVELVPAAARLYPLYLKIDQKRFFTDAEFNTICVTVAGDKRRIIQRVLLGIYQRAFVKKDAEEVRRARLMMTLHEAELLEKDLGAS
jgi:hypothetical protein